MKYDQWGQLITLNILDTRANNQEAESLWDVQTYVKTYITQSQIHASTYRCMRTSIHIYTYMQIYKSRNSSGSSLLFTWIQTNVMINT